MKSSKKITSLFLTLFILVFTLTALFACGETLYTVTFDSNGGSSVSSATVEKGEKLTAPTAPTKEDYIFMGWEGADGLWNFDDPVESDMTLVATWKKSDEADTVTVKFDSNGGTAVADLKIGKGATAGAPEAPQKAGYSFQGWMLDGKEFNFSTAIVKNITLTAKWTIVPYSVEYDLGGGTVSGNPTDYTVESDDITIIAPQKAGYDFLGWTFDGQTEPQKDIVIAKGSTGNKAYTANWALKNYSINYDMQGGTVDPAPESTYTIDSDDIAISNPTKADYVFLGWTFDGQTEPQKDLVIKKGSTGDYNLVANWSAVEYKINYDLGENADNAANPTSYTHEMTFALADPARPGYKFLGWTFEGQEDPTKDVTITLGSKGEKTFKANWEIITYTITYNTNEGVSASGEALKTTFTVEDLPMQLPSVIRAAGGSFTSWYTEEGFVNAISNITECKDIELFAEFKSETAGLSFSDVPGGCIVIVYKGTDSKVYIPDIRNGKRVVGIADNAFKDQNVTEVYIPYYATYIGDNAFAGSVSLEKVHIKGDGMLESIGFGAFASCSSITEINIPAKVESVGDYAFMSCASLKIVNLAADTKLSQIGKYAFENCSALTKIRIPANVTEIKEGTFSSCSKLENVIIDEASRLTSIGAAAFKDCAALASFNLPANVTAIYDSAFSGATSLKSFTFAEASALVTLGNSAFYNCDSLSDIAIPDGITEIGANAFYSADSLKTVTFGENSLLTKVGAYAFYNCKSFESITLPACVVSIGDSAFYACANLTSVSFGTSLTTVGRSAFYNCSSISEIKLPATLKTINKDAFSGCVSIKVLETPKANNILDVFGGKLPATLETVVIGGNGEIQFGAFANCTNLKSISINGLLGEAYMDGEEEKRTVPHFLDLFGIKKVSGDPKKPLTNEAAYADISLPETLKTIIISDSFTITADFFFRVDSIDSLVLDSDLTSIEAGALASMKSLKSLEIALTPTFNLVSLFGESPKSLGTVTLLNAGTNTIPKHAFTGSYVSRVILNSEIQKISDAAFKDVASLEEIVIPEGGKLSVIGSYAFENCSNLASFEFKLGGNVEINAYAFKGSSIAQLSFADETTLTLGEGAFENCKKLTSFDSVKTNLASVPDNAFKNCTSLSSFTVSSKLETIGSYAFENCALLTSFTSDEEGVLHTINIGAFKNSGLVTITLPKTLSTLSDGVFEGCSKLGSVTFATGSVLTSISEDAFAETSLKNITIPASITSIQQNAFKGSSLETITFEKGSLLSKIGSGAFEDCKFLTSIQIPDGVVIINNNTFKNCKSLATVKFGENSSLTGINAHAFENCSKLASINHPKKLAYIGDFAFAHCYALTSLDFTSTSLESIGSQAFYDCSGVKTLDLPKTLTNMGERAFSNCISLNTVSLKDSAITYIPDYAFLNCSSITSENLALPQKLTSVGVGAFEGCTKLLTKGEKDPLSYIKDKNGNIWLVDCDLTATEVNVLPGTIGIADSAFEGCIYLKKITLPDDIGGEKPVSGVKYIGVDAFKGCVSLTEVTLPNSVEVIGFSAFKDCNSIKTMSLPFTGNAKNGTENTHFGYIFGGDNSAVPKSLKTVNLTYGPVITSESFAGCSGITKLTISDSVTNVQKGAFDGCDEIISVENGVIYVDKWAISFIGTRNTVNLRSDTQGIADFAFENATSLSKISIPESTKYIGKSAFAGCSELAYIELPFIGNFDGSLSNNHFGYIFGAESAEENATAVPKTLATVNITGGTIIATNAFAGCDSITDIIISSSVTSIGKGAFAGCTSLETLTIPFVGISATSSENTHFGYIFGAENAQSNAASVPSSLKKVTISIGTKIAENAFQACSYITEISVPASTKEIGKGAFAGCTSLETLNIPFVGISATSSENTHFGYIFGATEALDNKTAVPESLKEVNVIGGTKLAKDAFKGCDSITSIALPVSVTEIGESAFAGCASLESITLPFVGSKDASAENNHFSFIFGGAKPEDNATAVPASLRKVNIIGGTTIAKDAFKNCAGITELSLPASLKAIGEDAFSGCTSLNALKLEDLASWSTVSFAKETSNPLYYAKNLYLNGEFTSEIVIPDGVTLITKYAFINASAESVSIPESVMKIEADAFAGCEDLTYVEIRDLSKWMSIGFENEKANPLYYAKALSLNGRYIVDLIIPEGVSSIGKYAFVNATFESVTIPESVTAIGTDAFAGCTDMRAVLINDLAKWISIDFATERSNPLYNANKLYLAGNDDAVSTLEIPAGIKAISKYAFVNLDAKSVNVPNSVSAIGKDAFKGCTSLESVVIKDLSAWSTINFANETANPLYYARGMKLGKAKIEDLELPYDIRSVSAYAFINGNFASITVPENITEIGISAFGGTSNLESITLPFTGNIKGAAENSHFGYIFGALRDRDNAEYVPSTLVKLTITESNIPENAFLGCTSLKTVVIKNGVSSIGNGAFKGCDSIESITLPFVGNSKASSENTHFGYIFGAVSFAYNAEAVPASLKTVILTGLTRIYDNAFKDCAVITNLEVPASLAMIGKDAFAGCSALESVKIADIGKWASIDFANETANPLFYAGKISNFKEASKLEIPDGTTIVSKYAFINCINITDIVIPSSVKEIGFSAFIGCTAVNSIQIPFVGGTPNLTENAHFGYIFGDKEADDNGISVPTTLKTVTVIGGERIAFAAFKGCATIETLTIPFVGGTANANENNHFAYIFGDENVNLIKSVPASLKKVIVTGNNIAAKAFYGCSGIKSIIISGDTAYIGNAAFSGCASLENLVIPFVGSDKNGTESTYFGYIFGAKNASDAAMVPEALKTVTINGGEKIAAYAFAGCSDIKTISLPDVITEMGFGVFENCTSLETLTIPFIGNIKDGETNNHFAYIFGGSTAADNATAVPASLKNITILSGTIIEASAFEGCCYINAISLPKSIKEIGNDAFKGCVDLFKLNIYDIKAWCAVQIGNEYSNPLYYSTILYLNDEKVFDLVIPEGVTVISPYAFINCKLKTLTLSSDLKQIGAYAFYNTGIQSIAYHKNGSVLEIIDDYAFYGCKKLANFTAPDSLKKIGASAFEGCTTLEEVTLTVNTTSVGANAFASCNSLATITVNYDSSLDQTAEIPAAWDPSWNAGITAQIVFNDTAAA